TNIMEKFIHATSDGKAEVRDSMASLHQVAEKISKRILDFGFFVYQKTDKELIRVGPFPGNLFMSLNAPSTFRGAHFTIEKSDVNAEKIEALDKNQIISLLEMAIKSAKSTIDMKKISEINEKTLKEFKELSKVLYSKISGTIDPDSKDTYKTIVEAIKYLIKMTAKISSKIPSIHFSTIKHVGDYASASISNYSE
ncbi:MAG TPA: hypothetical protein VN843_00640, partial [Anaerolineales bacterium]|nr:hypothetical protein [Anaerolineales bacterium]